MYMPLISVVIPTYNRADRIERSVRSVLDQTYRNIEVIIIDDGSSDHSKEVIDQIRDERVRYFYQENAGAASARNRGIDEAKGEWIAFQDSDDCWFPEKLMDQVLAAQCTYCDIVFCKLLLTDKQIELPKRIGEGPVAHKYDIYGVGTQTIMVRSDVAKNEKFNTSIPRYEDTEWLYRILKDHRGYCLDKPLVEYAINEDSLSSDYSKMYAGLAEIARLHPDLKKESPLISMHSSRDIMEGFFYHIKKGDIKMAWNFLRLLKAYYPGLFHFVMEKRAIKRRDK